MTRLLFALVATPFLLLAENPLPPDEHFRVHPVANGFVDAMEIAVTSDENVFVIERTGAVKLIETKSGKVKTIATLEVALRKKEHACECGLLGITLNPKFAQNNWVYLYYSLKKESKPDSLSQATNSSMKKASSKFHTIAKMAPAMKAAR